MTKSTDKWQDQAIEIRQQCWQYDVLTHAINPAFMGRPAWPSLHQAFVKVNTAQSVKLDFIIQHGSQGRTKLVELFQRQGSYHLSSLERASVI